MQLNAPIMNSKSEAEKYCHQMDPSMTTPSMRPVTILVAMVV